MQPEQRKKVTTIAHAVERWEERVRMLEEDEDEQKLPSAREILALKAVLPDDLREQVDIRSTDLKESYQKTREFVMRYAMHKRTRQKEKDTDPMDASTVKSWNGGGDHWQTPAED